MSKKTIEVFGLTTEVYVGANLDKPEFEKKGRVHDWRNYVPTAWKEHWSEFTERERKIIITLCEREAHEEEWD